LPPPQAVAHLTGLLVRKRIDPEIFGLHLHDLLEVDGLKSPCEEYW
jgi:hypothetical protein